MHPTGQMLAPFVFALIAAHGADAGEAACGPDCRGTCFSGKCLDDFPELDASFSTRSELGDSPSGDMQSLLQKGTETLQHLDPVDEVAVPKSPPSASAQESPEIDRSSLRRAAPATRPEAKSSDEKKVLTEEVKLLQARLALTKQREDLLKSENARLHGEVQGWVRLGNAVMHREAKLLKSVSKNNGKAKLLKSVSKNNGKASSAETRSPVGLLSRLSSTSSSESGSGVWSRLFSKSHPSFMLLFIIGTLFCELIALSVWWNFNRCKRVQLKPMNSMQPMLRAMGLAGKVVEFSELQVSGLDALGSEFLIQLCVGVPNKRMQSTCVGDKSRAVCTRAVEQYRPGGLLRFNESLTMAMKHSDGDCVFGVFRRDEPRETRIGHVRIPAKEVMALVNRVHGEYSRFDLELEVPRVGARQSFEDRDDGEDQRPYIAMRIRDVSALHQGSKTLDV